MHNTTLSPGRGVSAGCEQKSATEPSGQVDQLSSNCIFLSRTPSKEEKEKENVAKISLDRFTYYMQITGGGCFLFLHWTVTLQNRNNAKKKINYFSNLLNLLQQNK